MKRFYRLGAFALFSALLAVPAYGAVVERVVAVVGDKPILLSDVRKRMRPVLMQLYTSQLSAAEISVEESKASKELLQRMISERLIEQAADRTKKTISSEDVDRALKQRADSLHVTPQILFAEAKRQGLTEQDYRDEVRRQVVEGKLLQVRLQGRLRVTEDDAKAAYQKWLKELGTDRLVDVRILPLKLPADGNPASVNTVSQLATELTARARKGEDFCALVKAYSDAPSAKANCGSQGLQAKSTILPDLQRAIDGLKDGELPDPIRFGNEVIVVVQLAKAPMVPSYEDVKEKMGEAAMNDAYERQRKLWLDELRRGVYIDTRM